MKRAAGVGGAREERGTNTDERETGGEGEMAVSLATFRRGTLQGMNPLWRNHVILHTKRDRQRRRVGALGAIVSVRARNGTKRKMGIRGNV